MHCLRVDGDDASCPNLNFITSPHLLGVDAGMLAEGDRSPLPRLPGVTDEGFWEVLPQPAGENAIYGFLDQTVMQWGMKVKPRRHRDVAIGVGKAVAHNHCRGSSKHRSSRGTSLSINHILPAGSRRCRAAGVILAEMTDGGGLPAETGSIVTLP
ncbi:MAG: hypothetical protein MZV63_62885 [Marinilabiliales bacterium]|nr:hypothetical protein [Marinilabiliales bacterium]